MASALRGRVPLDLALPAGLAVALAAALLIEPDRPAAPARRVLPEIDRAELTAIRMTRPEGEVALTLGEAPALIAPVARPADPGAVAGVLGALEYLAPSRVVAAEPSYGLDRPRLSVTLERRGGGAIELRVGDELAGQGRVWVGRGGDARAYLVDRSAIDAIDLDADDLRARQVFAPPFVRIRLSSDDDHAVLPIVGSEVRLQRRARSFGRIRTLGPGAPIESLPIAADARAELERALARIRLESFSAPVDGPDRLRIETAGPSGEAWLGAKRGAGACAEGTVAVESWIGDGCVAATALDPLVDLDPTALIDRDLIATPPASIRAIRFTTGAIAADATVDPTTAEPVRDFVARFTAALGEPVPLDGEPLAGEIEVDGAAPRADHLGLYRLKDRGLAAARFDAKVGFRVAPDGVALLHPLAFRPRDLLAAEPSDVDEIVALRGGRAVHTLRRGALLDEWSGAPAGLDAGTLAADLARLRAAGWVAGSPTARHGFGARAIDFAVRGERHRLDLGAAAPDGECLARLDGGAVFRLAAPRCARLAALW